MSNQHINHWRFFIELMYFSDMFHAQQSNSDSVVFKQVPGLISVSNHRKCEISNEMFLPHRDKQPNLLH